MKTILLLLLFPLSLLAGVESNSHYLGKMETDGSVKAEAEIFLKEVKEEANFKANILWTPGPENQLTAKITSIDEEVITFLYRDMFGNMGKGTLTPKGNSVEFNFEAEKVVESRGARVGGLYILKKIEIKNDEK